MLLRAGRRELAFMSPAGQLQLICMRGAKGVAVHCRAAFVSECECDCPRMHACPICELTYLMCRTRVHIHIYIHIHIHLYIHTIHTIQYNTIPYHTIPYHTTSAYIHTHTYI